MENITENNQLIAEFMGVFDKILSTGNIHSWSDAPFYYTTEDTRGKVIKNISKYSKYSKDWNWLMQVVEKIENLSKEGETYMFSITKFSARVTYKGSRIVDLPIDNTKIEAVYNACVEFIKWYNKNN